MPAAIEVRNLRGNRRDMHGSLVESGRSRTETEHAAQRHTWALSAHPGGRRKFGSSVPDTESQEWSPPPLPSGYLDSSRNQFPPHHLHSILEILSRQDERYTRLRHFPAPRSPGKSVSLAEKAKALTLASDLCACQLSLSTLPPSPLPLSPWIFCCSHTGLFTISQANQEHSHLRPALAGPSVRFLHLL